MLKRLIAASALAILGVLGGVASAQSQTLVVWSTDQLADPATAELWNKIKAEFEAANPSVTVNYMKPTGNISNGAVQAAIQSNVGPDVLITTAGIGRVAIVANAKLVRPLTAEYDKRGWKDKIYPWLYKELAGQFGGDIYEVPDDLEAIGIWYHKDMFNKNGWSLKGGWAAFQSTLDKIRASGIEPIAVGVRNSTSGGHLFGSYLQAAAGREVMGQVVSGKIPWTDPRVIKGAQNLIDGVKAGHINPKMVSLDRDAAVRLWANKRAALFFAGPWFTEIARRVGYDLSNLGYATIPSDLEDGSLPIGSVSQSWMVPVSSKQPELAMKWIDFMLSDKIMRLRNEHISLPVRDVPDLKPALPVRRDAFTAAAKGIGYNPTGYIPSGAIDTYYQVIGGLIGGQVSANDGLAQIQGKMGQ
ncbi:ABC transporter substrate-binding protein [Bradyrhizobium erythrophlei]|uniref:ABC transporter substrate-binding protein n=1 Tax=Bradyrhizobium erythrophlei TaxID=1437360 RepID=UPI0035EDFDE9